MSELSILKLLVYRFSGREAEGSHGAQQDEELKGITALEAYDAAMEQ